MQEEIVQSAEKDVTQQVYAVIITNPASGSYAQHEDGLKGDMEFLRRQGWKVDLRLTKEAGDATRLAREAVAEKVDIVVAAGGDGTINEVIQGLAGSETALAVLPFGTVNVWSREMGIPLDGSGAREVLLHGKKRRIDLGQMNDRYFLLMGGIGLDGEIAHAVEKKGLKRLGVLGYLLTSIWYGSGYPGFRVQLKFGGRVIKTRALQIVIGNTQLYGGGTVKFTWQAKCDDGLLDLCIVHGSNLLGRAFVIIDFLLRRKQRRQGVESETCDSIEIRTRKPVAIQLDGDAVGYTPATFHAVPDALSVIVPIDVNEDLFSKRCD